jgi:uncharacterized membrane protein
MEGVNSYTFGVYKIGFEVLLFPFLLWYGLKQGLITWNYKAMLLAFLSCSLTTIADFSMLHLISKNNLSWVMAMTTPISLTLAIVVGVVAFKESLSVYQIIAIVLIMAGVFLLNK